MNGPYIDPKDLQPDTSNTNKDSGSGDELEALLLRISLDTGFYEDATFTTIDPGAIAALSAYTQRQVIIELAKLTNHDNYVMHEHLGQVVRVPTIEARIAVLTQQLNDLEGEL
jgi:hypothetical protein